MKPTAVVLVLIVGAAFASTAITEEVKVRTAPLTWKQAAIDDGESLYVELCAACHGASGMGDGPAAGALKKAVPNLTLIAKNNGGVFPSEEIEKEITGRNRISSHGSVDMPIWGSAFEDVRPDWKTQKRKAFSKSRIFNLSSYLESIQSE